MRQEVGETPCQGNKSIGGGRGGWGRGCISSHPDSLGTELEGPEGDVRRDLWLLQFPLQNVDALKNEAPGPLRKGGFEDRGHALLSAGGEFGLGGARGRSVSNPGHCVAQS